MERMALVDFKKHLTGSKANKPIDPVKLYDTLDRAHDKGPLRPAQVAVLEQWHGEHQETRDVIIKLHTGQGKTLIGLLMLQSQINAGKGAAIYLCPNNFLIDQTREQAKQFGITTCICEPELPTDFSNGTQILVTSVQKLFNGVTKFGLGRQSVVVSTILMDDAHTCADIVRGACRIRIPFDEPAYVALRTLFADDLEAQGAGTWADILNNDRNALLPVPYWAWTPRETDIARILSQYRDRDCLKFVWPLIRDILRHCHCVVSGAAIEIEPYIAPLEAFGSYWQAKHRIFMSATVTDDAFLVKGLQLTPETITRPLSYDKETWSGEKMVLLPSLIHESLGREEIVASLAKQNLKRGFGVVILAPSLARTRDWESYGATIAKKDSVGTIVDNLKKGEFKNPVVLVNRYDGIDLPDDTCRILVFDSRPYSENLSDLYQAGCRPNSEATLMRVVRTVEQGMGRSVRGEKDYCIILAIGSDLVRLLLDKTTRKYLSSQMAAQIDLGLEISDMARQEIQDGKEPMLAWVELMRQCLNRDTGWKAFYAEKMAQVVPTGVNEAVLRAYATELKAEQAYTDGDYATATTVTQSLLDTDSISADDKGWYLQEMARYQWRANRPESERLQVAAHKKNHLLLKPPSGVTVAKLQIVSQGRVERIAKWISGFGHYFELDASVSDILGCLVFGAKADRFEHALDQLSRALGFVGERPDKEWKEGPDNLWALDATTYILWECKNEVEVTRLAINKREAEQMNRSAAWFDKNYAGSVVKRFIVHPSNIAPSATAFTHEIGVVRAHELSQLVRSTREFFKYFEGQNFKDISTKNIQQLLIAHHLTVSDLTERYSKKLRDLK